MVMLLAQSRTVAPALQFLDEVGSTNAELVRQASAGPLDDFTVVATTNQTAGRGRLDRVWVAPAGHTIAVSVLLSPGQLPIQRLGWMPSFGTLVRTNTRVARE